MEYFGLPEYLLYHLRCSLRAQFEAATTWEKSDWDEELQDLYDLSKFKLDSHNDDWGIPCDDRGDSIFKRIINPTAVNQRDL